MILSDAVGYAATIVGISLMLPQAVKSWRTKQMHDVSFLMLWLYVLNCALWAAYGFLTGAPPVILANTICFGISVLLVGLKFRYRAEVWKDLYQRSPVRIAWRTGR